MNVLAPLPRIRFSSNNWDASSLPTQNNPVCALLLSCVVPGLGQVYNAERSKGLVLFFCCVGLIGLALWFSGLNRFTFALTATVLWISGIIDAYQTAVWSGHPLDWYYRPAYVTTMLVLVGPLALPLLWRSSYFTRVARYLWTVVILGGVLLLLATPYVLRWAMQVMPELETALRNAGISF